MIVSQNPRMPVWIVLWASVLVLAVVHAFEHIGGYIPCELCYLQRWPFYIAAALCAAWLLLQNKDIPVWITICQNIYLILLIIFIVSVGFGIYHSGVEWKWWAGPSGCGGSGVSTSGDLSNLMMSLDTLRVVPCDEAAGRFLGLSFAGYNTVYSALLAGFVSGLWLGDRKPRFVAGQVEE